MQSQCYRNTSKVMDFEEVYYDPLHVLFGPFDCIYDNKNLKLNGRMCNRPDYNRNQTLVMYHSQIPGKGVYKTA